MNQKGIPVSRWIDGVLEDKENIDQPDNLRAMVFWGHAPNSQTRMKEMKTAMEKLDLMVVIDPYPTVSAVLSDRTDGVYLLPATTQDLDAVDLDKARGTDFDALYEVESPPIVPPQAVELHSFSTALNQPLRGSPVRQGHLWHLLAQQQVELVSFSLYINGFSFSSAGHEVSVTFPPFSLVRNCKFNDQHDNAQLADMKIFKLSLFTQNLCYYYGIRSTEENQAENERHRWVVEISRAVQLVTQSLFPPFCISCTPLAAVSSTSHRLMAGYLLYHENSTVATVLYCELHPHCEVRDRARLVFYENDGCQRTVMEVSITVNTVCCEKVGVNCACFCIDGHQFSTRTCSERKLWLRATSNIKVKLQNHAPTPSIKDIGHYRDAIKEHLQTIEFALEGLAPIDELLQRLPRRKTLSMGRPPPVVAGVGFPSPEHGPSTPIAARTGGRNIHGEEATIVATPDSPLHPPVVSSPLTAAAQDEDQQPEDGAQCEPGTGGTPQVQVEVVTPCKERPDQHEEHMSPSADVESG
jgi:hypothetical protein